MNTTTATITTAELLDKLNAFDTVGEAGEGRNWWDDVAEAHADVEATNAQYGQDSNDGFVAVTSEGVRRIEYTGGTWQEFGEYAPY